MIHDLPVKLFTVQTSYGPTACRTVQWSMVFELNCQVVFTIHNSLHKVCCPTVKYTKRSMSQYITNGLIHWSEWETMLGPSIRGREKMGMDVVGSESWPERKTSRQWVREWSTTGKCLQECFVFLLLTSQKLAVYFQGIAGTPTLTIKLYVQVCVCGGGIIVCILCDIWGTAYVCVVHGCVWGKEMV